MFRTRTPLSLFRRRNTARLACVRPPASVHPEPGSNSPLYVCLTHSKFDFALVLIFYLVVYLYFNDLFSSAIQKLFLSFRSRFASAKVKLYFLLTKCFLKKFKVFFINLNLSINNLLYYSCAPSFWDCKDTKLFYPDNFFLKKIESFFSLVLIISFYVICSFKALLRYLNSRFKWGKSMFFCLYLPNNIECFLI